MITVIHPGIFTSIQDLGRFNYTDNGVPISGCMDQESAMIANAVLNNSQDSALLELTFFGGHFKFKKDTNICITGADMDPKINGKPIKMYRSINVKAKDELKLHYAKEGCRTYIAVDGGFTTPKKLNSRSMYQTVTATFKVSKGDELEFEKANEPLKSYSSIKTTLGGVVTKNIAVFKGPEFNMLTKSQIKLLLSKMFSISNESNRMAYTLTEPLMNELNPIITSIVLPGTVQLTPGGKLIILMRDSQITGGYPRILQLTKGAINALAQKQTNSQIQFNIV